MSEKWNEVVIPSVGGKAWDRSWRQVIDCPANGYPILTALMETVTKFDNGIETSHQVEAVVLEMDKLDSSDMEIALRIQADMTELIYRAIQRRKTL